MKDPRTVALALWSRLISGELLDEVDLQRLFDLTQQDSSLRKEFEADAALNALLRYMNDGQPTAEQFIQGVLEQCSTLESGVRPTGAVHLDNGNVDGISAETAPNASIRESTALNESEVVHHAHREQKHESPYRKSRQPSAWTAFILTTAIFAVCSLVIWIQVDLPFQETRNSLDISIVQEQIPKSPTVPEEDDTNTPRSIVSIKIDHDHQDRESDEPSHRPAVETPQVNPPRQNETITKHPHADSPGHFVTLTKIDDPVWEKKSVSGDRLGDEILRLFAGSVELTFDEGAVVSVNGPVEIRPLSKGQLELRRGRLFARVPRKAIGFTVSTPTSKVVDLGTEFEVAVNDAGESDVQVHKGEVEVAPITPDGDNFQKWRLFPSTFNRASFFASPHLQGPTPVSASLQGRRGQFQGFVSLNGQTAEFSSQEAFENVRRRVTTELSRSQENAITQWKEFVNSMQQNMQGTMNVNGQEMPFDSVQDLLRLQHRMFENVQNAASNSSDSGFSGSINVNGKLMIFKSREEFEAARRSAFGPAATFGIGDVFGDHSESR